jgi:tetratricopeptide (TPR) repeat protein
MIRRPSSGRLTAVVSVLAVALCAAPALAQEKTAGAKGASASATLDRAVKLYDSDELHSASIELYKVIEGESGDSEANKQKAEFWMGKTLYKQGFYSAALTYFDKIVQKGPSHAHYNETLKWLASLSREVPDSSGILDKIGKYDRKELEQPALESVRDELYFLLGKYHYNKGKFKEAVALFNMVPRESPYYVQAKLFEGATHVREYNAKPAIESFKEVLRVGAESDDPKVKPYEDLANLSLARTFYSMGGYEMAAKYYDRVSMDSYDWPNSLFEASWANFMLRNAGYSKALGNIQSLQAPYFDNFVKPESVAEALTVKATIYFYNCQYDRAADAIQEFQETYAPLSDELKKIAAGTTANDQFYEVADKIRNGDSNLPKNVEAAARAVLSDRMLARRFD